MFKILELKPLGTFELQTSNPKNGECYLIEYTVVSQIVKYGGIKSILNSSGCAVHIAIKP